MALGAAEWLGVGVVDVVPGGGGGGGVGWGGVAASVQATEAYDQGGLPGWAIGVMGAGVVSVGGAATGISGGSCGGTGAAGVDGSSSWGRLASDRMGVCGLSGALGASACGLSGALGASDSERNGMGVVSSMWRGGGGGCIARGNDGFTW